MRVQVLVAAMHQSDHTLPDRMNIRSDVIVGNQCDRNTVEKFDYKGHTAVYLNFAERGVGLNRNNSLMRADGDICLFADDDMVYMDDYVETVQKAFEEFPDADVIVFNLQEETVSRYMIPRKTRVNYLNYLRYGTARVAFRLSSIKRNAIYFNQCFGGGTEHCHGEDNLFLTACLNKGLKIYAFPAYIAKLTEIRQSTWNNGYGEKYLMDQGALYRAISRKWWCLLCVQDAVRHKGLYHLPVRQALKLMFAGGRSPQ